MKKGIKRFVSCIIVICLSLGMLFCLTTVLERKESIEKYSDFFEQESDFDVLFMGNSHVINAIFPMELWNKYGIVSYNLGGHGSQIPTTYWILKNALDYTSPKVVVIDCSNFTMNYKGSPNFSYIHQSLDAFPLSKNKMRAVWDLTEDNSYQDTATEAEEAGEKRTKIGLLWDYSVYHSRWNELGKSDFVIERNREKGAESRIRVVKGELNRIDFVKLPEEGSVGEKYLRQMIEECQNDGIEVLLTYLPFPAAEGDQMDAAYAGIIAEEYGINYINFLDLDLINYQTDLFDEASHLNPSGARKVSSYLGNVLMNRYGVENHKEDARYSDWKTDYEDYCALKNENLENTNDLESFLMLLSGDEVVTQITVRDNSILLDDRIAPLIDNIENLSVVISEDNDSDIMITVKRNGVIVAEKSASITPHS